MKLRKIFFGAMIALTFLFSLAPHALAQDPNRLTQLKVSVWPEYDTPTVLVLLDGTLADSANLPREISVLIPAGAQLTVTTWANADGSLAAEQPNKTTDLGDGFVRVTFTTSQPNLHVEYYHDLLRGSPDKTMDFAYKSASLVDLLTLEIQQPLKAANFGVTPATLNTRVGTDGFKYFTYSFSNVTAGQTVSAQAKYNKTDPNPSVQAAPAQIPAPVVAPTTGSSNNNLILLAGLVTLGLAGILGFLFWQQRSRDEDTEPAKMPARQFQRNRKRARQTAEVFCTQCGSPIGVDDNFCPKCGAKRRVV
jgi:LPXTG-motif cell wall-anchored protein